MELRIYTLILSAVIRKLEVLVVIFFLLTKEIATARMIRWVRALRVIPKEIPTAIRKDQFGKRMNLLLRQLILMMMYHVDFVELKY